MFPWGGGSVRTADIGDNITNSIMLDRGSLQYLSRTVTTSATATYILAFKRGILGAICPLIDSSIKFNANDTLTAFGLTTTAVFRDPAAWLFIHVSNGGLYVNGTSYGAVTTSALTNPRIGFDGTNYADGYLAMCYIVDGTSDAYTNYGRTSADTAQWVNKNAYPTYGAKGSLLTFSNSGALGTDSSGNGNNWTLNGGITSANQYTDTPTNNYCVLNPLKVNGLTVLPKLGNTRGDSNSLIGGSYNLSGGLPVSGKVYIETTVWAVAGSGQAGGIGFSTPDLVVASGSNFGGTTESFLFFFGISTTWAKKYNNVFTNISLSNIIVGSVMMVAYDPATGAAWVGKDGTWNGTGNPSTGANPDLTGISSTCVQLAYASYRDSGANSVQHTVNAGARPFTYTPPTGFKALCTANLPEGTAAAPVTFTGNASADGTYIAMNGTPETLSINGNAVTWGTHADRTAGGVKLRTASASYNASGSNTISASTFLTPNRKSVQKYQTAKGN